MLCRSVTNPGCLYLSYFTSEAAPEVKVEWSLELRVEQSLELKVEQSSEVEVEWSSEWQKCEMGCPLTITVGVIHKHDLVAVIKGKDCVSRNIYV